MPLYRNEHEVVKIRWVLLLQKVWKGGMWTVNLKNSIGDKRTHQELHHHHVRVAHSYICAVVQ